MAMARAMPGQPEGRDEDGRRTVLTTTATDRRDDRRHGVLAGVERPGEDGDQGVGHEADENASRVAAVSCDGRRRERREEQGDRLGRQDRGQAGDRDHHEDDDPHRPDEQAPELVEVAERRPRATASGTGRCPGARR